MAWRVCNLGQRCAIGLIFIGFVKRHHDEEAVKVGATTTSGITRAIQCTSPQDNIKKFLFKRIGPFIQVMCSPIRSGAENL